MASPDQFRCALRTLRADLFTLSRLGADREALAKAKESLVELQRTAEGDFAKQKIGEWLHEMLASTPVVSDEAVVPGGGVSDVYLCVLGKIEGLLAVYE